MTKNIIRFGLTSLVLVSCVLTANLLADDQPGTTPEQGMTDLVTQCGIRRPGFDKDGSVERKMKAFRA